MFSNGLRKSANDVLLNDASLRARGRRVPRCPTSRFSSPHLPDGDDSERRRAQVTRRRRAPSFVVSVSRQNHELSLTRFFPRVPTTANAGIEDLREKREEINQQITDEEDEKSKVQSDLTVLSKRLTTLNDSIARKVRTRETPFARTRSIDGRGRLSVGKTRASRHDAHLTIIPSLHKRSPRGTITIRPSRRQKPRT